VRQVEHVELLEDGRVGSASIFLIAAPEDHRVRSAGQRKVAPEPSERRVSTSDGEREAHARR
jgi:hypothetical protein